MRLLGESHRLYKYVDLLSKKTVLFWISTNMLLYLNPLHLNKGICGRFICNVELYQYPADKTRNWPTTNTVQINSQQGAQIMHIFTPTMEIDWQPRSRGRCACYISTFTDTASRFFLTSSEIVEAPACVCTFSICKINAGTYNEMN